MLYRPSSFHKTAFAVTAAAAIGGASVLASFPANAQQTTAANSQSLSPACAPFAGTERGVRCEIEQSQLRTKAANGQTQAEAALKKCLIQIADFKKAQPAEFAKLGDITRENACEKASKLPRVSASLN